MRRPLLKASPAALKRAAEMYRPFGQSPVFIGKKPVKNNKQIDPKVERKGNPKNQ